MANKKKKRRSATVDKKTKKPFPIEKALKLVGITSAVFAAYQFMLKLEHIWIVHVYWIALALIAMAYIALNRGCFTVATEDMLPEDWSKEEKTDFIELQKARRKKSEPLLYLLIAVMFTLLFDTVYLFLELNLNINLGV